jgi:hypothetical protein
MKLILELNEVDEAVTLFDNVYNPFDKLVIDIFVVLNDDVKLITDKFVTPNDEPKLIIDVLEFDIVLTILDVEDINEFVILVSAVVALTVSNPNDEVNKPTDATVIVNDVDIVDILEFKLLDIVVMLEFVLFKLVVNELSAFIAL